MKPQETPDEITDSGDATEMDLGDFILSNHRYHTYSTFMINTSDIIMWGIITS